MSDLRQVAQQALAFTMRDFATVRDFDAARAVLQDALRAALEAQEEPRREWQGLSDDEVDDMSLGGTDSELRKQQFARAIEAALKERNHE